MSLHNRPIFFHLPDSSVITEGSV